MHYRKVRSLNVERAVITFQYATEDALFGALGLTLQLSYSSLQRTVRVRKTLHDCSGIGRTTRYIIIRSVRIKDRESVHIIPLVDDIVSLGLAIYQ
jgi:hypothetical protein